jgi:RNA polymerase sigma factor for flagellar operon FliA
VLHEDLFAAGVFGLVNALAKNGGAGGATFEWYARTRIRGAVLDELRAQDWLTRRARDAVNAQREETDADIAVLVGLDDLSAEDEEEFLAACEWNPAAAYEAKETGQKLAAALDKLSERERRVIAMHYFDDATYKDIGAELRVCEPRVFQLHARAIERLRAAFTCKGRRRALRPEVRPSIMTSVSSSDGLEDVLPANDLPSDVA